MSGPCAWTISPTCEVWADLTPEEQARATNYATYILWSRTGRQFGLCELTVRPCGRQVRPGSMWGYVWDTAAGGWYPYLDAGGTWRNCSCGLSGCGCGPRCEVWLPGPVDSVTEVIQDGVVVDPAAYKVDDRRWLVRIDGECWPDYADLSTDTDRFQVTYLRGTPVPAVLTNAAEILACEFAKSMRNQECRLPGRMSSLTRQGVQVSFVDVDSVLRRGLTGVPEVDQVILAINPNGLPGRPRVMSPDIQAPRIRR